MLLVSGGMAPAGTTQRMQVIGADNASPANISGGIVAVMDVTVHGPDQVAVCRALLDASAGDHMTLVELCAVASAAAGLRVEWFTAHRIVGALHTAGCVTRTVVQCTGQPKQQAYALNLRGRRRIGRLLGGAAGGGDDREDVFGGFDKRPPH